MSFSIILPIFDKRDWSVIITALFCWFAFLQIGITFAVFRVSGKAPVSKVKLMK